MGVMMYARAVRSFIESLKGIIIAYHGRNDHLLTHSTTDRVVILSGIIDFLTAYISCIYITNAFFFQADRTVTDTENCDISLRSRLCVPRQSCMVTDS